MLPATPRRRQHTSRPASIRHDQRPRHVLVAGAAEDVAVKREATGLVRPQPHAAHDAELDVGPDAERGQAEAVMAIYWVVSDLDREGLGSFARSVAGRASASRLRPDVGRGSSPR